MNVTASTILIVDDELVNREALESMLQPEGYHTESASTGTQAIASILNEPPDLILLDVSMPGMDGYEVASLLKANPSTASIPIIMVTAHAGRGAKVVGLGTGVEDYLTKPVDSAELALKVRNLLRLRANAHADPVTTVTH